jgi:hypothetical protein
MPYLMGVLTGVLLTVLGVFVPDNLAVANAPSGTEPQKIVNWDVAAQKLRSSPENGKSNTAANSSERATSAASAAVMSICAMRFEAPKKAG